MPVQVRGDYRGHGDPVEPAYVFTPPVLFDYVSDDGNSMNKFNSLTATAQEKLIEILRETKKAMGNSYVPVYITSGLRTPKYHFQTVLEKRLENQTAYKYYLEQSGSASLTTKYLKLIEYQLYKKELNKEDWLNITYMKEDIVKIKQGDFAEAEKILIQLMKDWVIKGTDHREGNAVDISPSNSHEAKKQLVEFLNSLGKYKMFLYLNDKATYTAEKGGYRLYYGAKKYFDLAELQVMWTKLEASHSPQWYFHIQQA